MLLQHDLSSGLAIRGFGAEDDFTYTAVDDFSETGGSVVDTSYYDCIETTTTTPSVANNFQMNVRESLLLPGYTLINQTPSIVSVSGDSVTRIANGTAIIDIVTPVGTRRYTRTMTNVSSVSYRVKNYKTGSVGLHIKAAVDAMISGKTPGSPTQKFTTTNNNNPANFSASWNSGIFTGNPASGGLDFSAITLSHPNDGYTTNSPEMFPWVLISPRHIIAANHIFSGASDQAIAWLTPAGAVKTATVLSAAHGGHAINVSADLAVGYLSTPITGITPASILPANYLNYMCSVNLGTARNTSISALPILYKCFNGPADRSYSSVVGIGEISGMGTSVLSVSFNAVDNVADTDYGVWGYGTRGGDSGTPVFLPINNQAVLLGCLTMATAFSPVVEYVDWIESAMNTLATNQGDPAAGTYELTRCDLSGFTQYTTV